jgi:hypothetical protein
VVGARFRRQGRGGEAVLLIDDQPAGAVAIPFAMTMMSSVGPSVGYDHGSPVSDRYLGPFPFEGGFSRLDVVLTGPRQDQGLAAAEERAAMARQ